VEAQLWSCGHTATAACAECHRELVEKCGIIYEENRRLRDEIHMLREALFITSEQILKGGKG
jgi:hypothetical protein